jgi:branched-chain amino acid transport system permease protein
MRGPLTASTSVAPPSALERGRVALSRLKPYALLAFAVLMVAFPQVYRDDYAIRILCMIMIWSMLAIGQNVITGFCGQLSVGHAAFYGIGAYTSALLTMRLDLPFPLALLAAGLMAMVLGVVVGFPAIRIGGDYLFIVTIGFSEIVRLTFLNWNALTNGPMGMPGIPPAEILGYLLTTNTHYYYLLLGLLALIIFATWQIIRSDIGRSFQAIREDETAALAMGVNVTFYKLLAFAIGAFFAGLAGSVLAHFLAFVGPDGFTVDESVLVFEMVILGGLGSIAGSVLGAALLVGSVELIRGLVDYRLYVGGILLIVMMIWRPQGLIGTVRLKTPGILPDPLEAPTEPLPVPPTTTSSAP